MTRLNCLSPFVMLVGWVILLSAPSIADDVTHKLPSQLKLPDGEIGIELFDGKSLSGWQGITDSYWSVQNGVIVGRNEKPNPASTYLFTEKSYRDFRLLLEVKQTVGANFSTMHSAVCCLGEIIEDNGQAFGFRGPLLMFCRDWGIWDAHRRNRVFPAQHRGVYLPDVERVGDWNQIEILVRGNRIQMAANGKAVMDFTDAEDMLQPSPIGLQLHGNAHPQEFQFRKLVIVENPTDVMASIATTTSQNESLPTASPEDVGMSSAKLNEVDEAMKQSIAENRIAGGVVMIARNGKVVLQRAYGKRDLEADTPMEVDTIMRIYSMTKAITTTAALMLVEEGSIAIEDPVSKYLPQLESVRVVDEEGTQSLTKDVTIADLMRHTAGYSYDNSGSAQYDAAFKKLRVIERDIPSNEFQTKLADLPLLFQPGTDWHYGISTDVLGRVVEVVSGLSLAEFFQQRIFGPLGMVDTGFSVPANRISRFAANYNTDGKGKLTLLDAPQSSRYLESPAFASGGGGLVSTASDYMRFLMMIEAGGTFAGVRLLKPETVTLMTTNQVPPRVGWIKFGNEVRSGVGFGFGFSVREQASDWDPKGRLGEYGWGGAASTHYWISPKDRLIVITLEQVMPYQWLTELKLKGVIYDAIEAPR